jgi:transcriptional regulator with XRE-family HTH domain
MSRSRKPKPTTASEVVARRVRALRTDRGWSAQRLADAVRDADPSCPLGNRDVVANLESGRRTTVTIDEVMVLALVLDTSPTTLFLPNGNVRLQVGALSLSASRARDWAVGPFYGPAQPLPSQDAARFSMNAATHNEPESYRTVPDETIKGSDALLDALADRPSFLGPEPITVTPEAASLLVTIALALNDQAHRQYHVKD